MLSTQWSHSHWPHINFTDIYSHARISQNLQEWIEPDSGIPIKFGALRSTCIDVGLGRLGKKHVTF